MEKSDVALFSKLTFRKTNKFSDFLVFLMFLYIYPPVDLMALLLHCMGTLYLLSEGHRSPVTWFSLSTNSSSFQSLFEEFPYQLAISKVMRSHDLKDYCANFIFKKSKVDSCNSGLACLSKKIFSYNS